MAVTRHDMTTEGGGFHFHFDTTGDHDSALLSYDNTTGSHMYLRRIWMACGTNAGATLKEGSAGATIASLLPDTSALYRHLEIDTWENPILVADGTSLALVALDGHVTGDIDGYWG
jgi:hypothetical protein